MSFLSCYRETYKQPRLLLKVFWGDVGIEALLNKIGGKDTMSDINYKYYFLKKTRVLPYFPNETNTRNYFCQK